MISALALALAWCLVCFPLRADDSDAGTAKLPDSEYCKRTRPPRVQAVQSRTREWLKRLASMRAACTVAPLTDEVMAVGPIGPYQDTLIDDSNVRCISFDAAVGLALRPLVNDEPALRRILAWKPAK